MIQGTDIENFKKFYYSGLLGIYIANKKHRIFIFLELSNKIKNVTFAPINNNMKYFLFITINNILSQEEIDILVVLALTSIFSLDDLIKVISIYLRGIYNPHIYDNKYFQPNIKDAEKVKNYSEKEIIESKVSDISEISNQSDIEEDTI